MRWDVLAALRAAPGPLTSLDIARQVIVARKLDLALTTIMRKRVGAALFKLKAREVPQAGHCKAWLLRPYGPQLARANIFDSTCPLTGR